MTLSPYGVKSINKCMKKAAKWLSLAAFVMRFGGAGGI